MVSVIQGGKSTSTLMRSISTAERAETLKTAKCLHLHSEVCALCPLVEKFNLSQRRLCESDISCSEPSSNCRPNLIQQKLLYGTHNIPLRWFRNQACVVCYSSCTTCSEMSKIGGTLSAHMEINQAIRVVRLGLTYYSRRFSYLPPVSKLCSVSLGMEIKGINVSSWPSPYLSEMVHCPQKPHCCNIRI